jgi:hypothetical protein
MKKTSSLVFLYGFSLHLWHHILTFDVIRRGGGRFEVKFDKNCPLRRICHNNRERGTKQQRLERMQLRSFFIISAFLGFALASMSFLLFSC